MKIRTTQENDIADLKKVLDETELFPGDMLPDMLHGFLSDPHNQEVWLTCEADRKAVGFCFAVPEQFTQGTWNMLAIGVLPARQGTGVGSLILEELESLLRKRGNRILIVDTSGTEAFAQTREFYRKNGYAQEARIREFWAVGDDKVTFWKSL